jgi:hypothetical protein
MDFGVCFRRTRGDHVHGKDRPFSSPSPSVRVRRVILGPVRCSSRPLVASWFAAERAEAASKSSRGTVSLSGLTDHDFCRLDATVASPQWHCIWSGDAGRMLCTLRDRWDLGRHPFFTSPNGFSSDYMRIEGLANFARNDQVTITMSSEYSG